MATSGVTTWTLNELEVYTEALEMLGVLEEGETPSPEQVTSARRTANIILKAWQVGHIYLHTREWVQKTFTASSEVTGTDGSIYTCILSHTATADNCPVTGANYTTYWSQKGDTGGTWTLGTAYASIGDFTPDADTFRIEKAFIRDAGTDTPVWIKRMADYMDLSDKDATGKPYMMVYDKQLSPRCYLHYQPDLTSYVLHYLKVRRIEDFTANTINSDLPIEGLHALTLAIAYKLSFKYGKPLNERLLLKEDLKAAMRSLKDSDDEAADDSFIEGAY